MSGQMWKLLDQVENPPFRLTTADRSRCYYARDYASGKDYSYGENGLIKNFKKDVSKRGTGQWHYKQQAITQFALELASWLLALDVEFHISPIPCSMRSDHPMYDSRLDDVLQQFALRCPNARVSFPIRREVTMPPAHQSGGSRPSVDEVYDSLGWYGLERPPNVLLLVDDVVTAGTSFKACQRLISEHVPDVELYGIFWARTIWPDAPNSDVDLSEFCQ